ncbi:MAG: TIGR02466 family protein [Sneathiellaceae bacterium]
MAGQPFERVDVKAVFATPFTICRLANAGPVNAALRTRILAREGQAPGNVISNVGGWQSEDDFLDWGGPEGAQVIDAAKALAGRLTAARGGAPGRPAWRVHAWANVNRAGQWNDLHAHPGNFWSAAYYVDDGGAADDPSLGGAFEIHDPRGLTPAMYAPGLVFAMPEGDAAGAGMMFRPRAGEMFLFPAWLNHSVHPYSGSGTRISIAFNLAV